MSILRALVRALVIMPLALLLAFVLVANTKESISVDLVFFTVMLIALVGCCADVLYSTFKR